MAQPRSGHITRTGEKRHSNFQRASSEGRPHAISINSDQLCYAKAASLSGLYTGSLAMKKSRSSILAKFAEVESAFISACLGESSWEEAMNAVSAASSASGAALFCLQGRPPPAACSATLREAIDVYTKSGWQTRDERYNGVALLQQRGVVTDLDFTNLEAVSRSPFYQDFLGQFGLRWFAGLKIHNGQDVWCLSIQRSTGQDPFSVSEQQRLTRWYPRLSTAAAFGRAIGQARAEGASDALDALGAAGILLSGSGMVLRVNRMAEALFDRDFTVRNGLIILRDSDAITALHRAYAEILGTRFGNAVSEPVVIPREQGRPLVLRLLRFDVNGTNPFGPCKAMVMIDDTSKILILDKIVLRQIWGLTEAEVAVAVSIGAGNDLDMSAAELGISKETARTQLKAVFAKTDTKRQAELIALLARLNRTSALRRSYTC